jgi:hypothetical protein
VVLTAHLVTYRSAREGEAHDREGAGCQGARRKLIGARTGGPAVVAATALADTLGAVGDGGLAAFGAELEARATPEVLGRIAELDQLSTISREQEAAVALEYFRLEWPGYLRIDSRGRRAW